MVGEIEKLQDEIRKNPNDVQALRKLAVLFQRQGNFKDAVWSFIRCTDLDPEDHKIFLRAAQCFYDAGQENMSLMFAQKALDLGGDQAKQQQGQEGRYTGVVVGPEKPPHFLNKLLKKGTESPLSRFFMLRYSI